AGANKMLVDATRDPSSLVTAVDPQTGQTHVYVRPPASIPGAFDGISFQHAGLDPATGEITRGVTPEQISARGLTPIVDPENIVLVPHARSTGVTSSISQ